MRRSRLIMLLLLTLVAIVFSMAIFNGFVTWDDEPLIFANPNIAQPTLRSLGQHWAHPHMKLYIPVIYTAWWTLARFQSMNWPPGARVALDPLPFHAANVVVHALAVLVVFRILKMLVGKDWPAAGGTLLFALHPLQVEPVAWATGMKDVLGGLLFLTALWAYLIWAKMRRDALPRKPWHYPLASVLFILALLAKPSAVTLPIVAGCIDWLLFRRRLKDVFQSLAPWLALSLLVGVATTFVQPAGDAADLAPLWARPLVAADALAFYFYKFVWPATLAINYGRTPATAIANHWAYFTWIFPAGLAILLYRLRRPLLTAAGICLVASLLPMLGLTPFLFQRYSTVADRYMYVAILGPALAVATLLTNMRSRFVAPICLLVLLALAVRSFTQIPVWHDSVSLYANAVEANPTSVLMTWDLAVALDRSGRPDLALPRYIRAIELQAHFPEPDAQGRFDDLRQLVLPRLEKTNPDLASQLAEALAKLSAAKSIPAPATGPVR